METILVHALKGLVLPPISLLLLALVAVARLCFGGPSPRTRRMALVILSLALLGLLGLSLPVVSQRLATGLESQYPALAPGAPVPDGPQAIVVLGAGLYFNPPEYAEDSPTGTLLIRLRYAAHLQARTGLPVLVSGGSVFAQGEAEAAIMRRVLEQELHTPVRWLEGRSRNTAENAFETAAVLRPEHIERVLVVTHALHIPRAMACFRRAGLKPIAAPTRFVSRPNARPALLDWLPNAAALELSNQALHEYLGLYWYRLRYGFGA